MAHTRAWSNSVPDGSTDFADHLDTFHQEFRTDVNERMSVEQYWNISTDDTSATGDGRHQPGIVGTMFKGTTAAISALASNPGGQTPGEGALAWDSLRNVLMRYNFALAQWEIMGPIAGGATFKARLSATTPYDVLNDIVCDVVDKNTIGNYDNTTGIMTVTLAGLYMVVGRVEINNLPSGYTPGGVVIKNGNTEANIVTYGSGQKTSLTTDAGSTIADLVELEVGDELKLSFYVDVPGVGISGNYEIEGSDFGQTYFGATFVSPP